jgi:hypothetical protein
VSWVVAVLGLLSQGALAQDKFVGCPVEQLSTAVVSPLPDGWWATPQQGELLSTEVRAIGGAKTLICNYRGFGTTIAVMREMPGEFAACAPAAGGFSCGSGTAPGGTLTPATQAVVEAPVSNGGAAVTGTIQGPAAPTKEGDAPRVDTSVLNPRKPGDGVER